MTTPLGMDPEQVRAMAAQFTAGATSIRDLTSSIGSQVETVSWTGADREAFLSEWQTIHVSNLTIVADSLDSAAARANQNATDQEAVSAG